MKKVRIMSQKFFLVWLPLVSSLIAGSSGSPFAAPIPFPEGRTKTIFFRNQISTQVSEIKLVKSLAEEDFR
jgi:hypothetical protein